MLPFADLGLPPFFMIWCVAPHRGNLFNGEIIEDYPEDKRGHSCLMFGMPNNRRPVHVVCAPKEEYLAIITVYMPSLEKWEADFKTRRGK
jgi:hypothetical protein